MLTLSMTLEGDIDIDRVEVDVECPRCGFSNSVWLRQARLRDVVICRGCKNNVQLDDGMNSIRKAYRSIRNAMAHFRDSIAAFNRSLG